jgi:hypothetical protein
MKRYIPALVLNCIKLTGTSSPNVKGTILALKYYDKTGPSYLGKRGSLKALKREPEGLLQGSGTFLIPEWYFVQNLVLYASPR